MVIYWIIIIIGLLLMSIRYYNYNYNSEIYGRYIIIFLVIMMLFFVYVFRSLLVGRDYLQYYTWYSLYNLSGFKDTGAELGYAYLSSFARYFGFFKIIPIFTFLIVLLSILCVKKCLGHINGFTLLSFFILLGLFTSMFNPIRESIAFGFISFGISFLLMSLNHHVHVSVYNFIITSFIYILFVLLAYGFHKTAVFGIIFLVIPFIKYRCTKATVIISGLLMIYLSFTGFVNRMFTRFISLDSAYTLKYQHNSLNVKLSFMHILIKISPLLIQLIFLYIFVTKYENFNDNKFKFIMWGYLFYLFMFTAPGSNIARRLQMYTFIFPLMYSCLFMDGLIINKKKINRISNLTKFMFVSFWMMFYVLKIYFDASGIVPYSFA